MGKGYLCIILHAHLPFVRHPEHESFFEENWLFEAITECYVPLVNVLDRLLAEGIDYRLTISFSPPLLSMLRDEFLQTRYLSYLGKLIELSEKEIERTRNQPEHHNLARLYRRFFGKTLETYRDRYRCDLPAAFKKHQDAGKLELITSAATHGFLPLLSISETAVSNQIRIGVETFTSNLGCAPAGFWLPECGYYPGLEKVLNNAGIKYFFTEAHGVLHASRRPRHGVYAPLDCGNGVAAFARDPDSSHQVWSSHHGYPGDYDYREFYSDIGFQLDLDYISPYILDEKIRINTGIKYHRVTGGDSPKEIYRPEKALEKTRLHARDFIDKNLQKIARLAGEMDRPPIVVAPFDAELFGHWWFEGPLWLEHVLRLAAENREHIEAVSCSDYLSRIPTLQMATPSASTWGEQGYSSYWLNETNDWIYPLLHKAGANMEKLAYDFKNKTLDPLQERALNQAARSLLLAQASDWPFIMKSGTTIEYAKKRITDHLSRFNFLQDSLRKNRIDERYLIALEVMDNIFPDIDFRDFSPAVA
ncbi:MAG: glycoside hydrolase family 57 protein [Gammaproteobacteria bacterium]